MNSGDLTFAKLAVSGVNSEVLLTVKGAASPASDIVQIQNSTSTLLSVSQNYAPSRNLAWDVITGRLTLTSGNPDPRFDQTGSTYTTIYYTPFLGVGQIKLWNSNLSVYELLNFTELSQSITSFAANLNWDIFVSNSNNGTCSLGWQNWSNDTTRLSTLSNDGGYIYLTGVKTDRYVGTIRAVTGSGNSAGADSRAQRYVWNMYNQVIRPLYNSYTNSGGTPAGYWTYPGTGASNLLIRPANNITGSCQVDWVLGMPTWVQATYSSFIACSAGGNASIGISVNQTSGWSALEMCVTNSPNAMQNLARTWVAAGIGHNWMMGLDGVYGTGTAGFWSSILEGWLMA